MRALAAVEIGAHPIEERTDTCGLPEIHHDKTVASAVRLHY